MAGGRRKKKGGNSIKMGEMEGTIEELEGGDTDNSLNYDYFCLGNKRV